MTDATVGRNRSLALGVHPHLLADPLPLSVSGLETFFGEIIAEIAGNHFEIFETDVSRSALIAYGEQRLPAIFSRDSEDVRGVAISALDATREEVENSVPPEGISWPINPIWLARHVSLAVNTLVLVMHDFDRVIPGSVKLATQIKREILPPVTGTIRGAESEVYTGFLNSELHSRGVQYKIRRKGTTYFLRRRKWGGKTWEKMATFPAEAIPGIYSLLRWIQGNDSVGL